MERKATSIIVLALLLASTLSLAFKIQPVKANGTIYIRADGSVEGTDKIQRDGDIYTFIDNIHDEIAVERDNILIDGADYALQGTDAYLSKGIDLTQRNNVTIKNIDLKAFYYGIWLSHSSNNTILKNNVTENRYSIYLFDWSSDNVVSENNITNNENGVFLYWSSNDNIVSENNMSNNQYSAVDIAGSSNNAISENNIAYNRRGVKLFESSYNEIYHNNFMSNYLQVYDQAWDQPWLQRSLNVWDDGYPSSGNYWSDYDGVDEKSGINQDQPGIDAIGDTPYVIDADNQDRYPLVIPWTERKVGVKAGDWAKYGDYVVTWSSNDPGQHPPTNIQEWMNVTVQNTAGTNITFQLVMHYQMSTEYTTIGWQDVSTSDARGQMGLPLFISADLKAGDPLYQTIFPVPINETILCEYVGVTRETSHFSFEWSFQYINPTQYFNGSLSAYWDRATGILTEYTLGNIFVDETLNYVTSTSIYFHIVDTNIWKALNPTEETQELIETIKIWSLPKGTENSLTSKLEDTLHLLDIGNENGATHKLIEFMSQADALREKKLTDEQADYLTSEAQRIIDLING